MSISGHMHLNHLSKTSLGKKFAMKISKLIDSMFGILQGPNKNHDKFTLDKTEKVINEN